MSIKLLNYIRYIILLLKSDRVGALNLNSTIGIFLFAINRAIFSVYFYDI